MKSKKEMEEEIKNAWNRERILVTAVFFIFLSSFFSVVSAFSVEKYESKYEIYHGEALIGKETVKGVLYEDENAYLLESRKIYPYSIIPRIIFSQYQFDLKNLRTSTAYKSCTEGRVSYRSWIMRQEGVYFFCKENPPFMPLIDESIMLEKEPVELIIDLETISLQKLIFNSLSIDSGVIKGEVFNGLELKPLSVERLKEEEESYTHLIKYENEYYVKADMRSGIIEEVKRKDGAILIRRTDDFVPMEVKKEENGIFAEGEISLKSEKGPVISGSLALPEAGEDIPCMILIGEGYYDRRMGGIFEDIAEYLVERGIGVFSYDLRGLGESEGSYGVYSFNDLTEDAERIIHHLKTTEKLDSSRIGVLGFGRGGYIALSVAASNPQLKVCVLMGAPAVPYIPDSEILRLKADSEEQNWSESYYKGILDLFRKNLELSEKMPGDWISINNTAYSVTFTRSCKEVDPENFIELVNMPVLILHGSLDSIYPPEQAEILNRLFIEKGKTNQTLDILSPFGHHLGVYKPPWKTKPHKAEYSVNEKAPAALYKWLSKNL